MDETVKQILKRIGKSVAFQYPEGEPQKTGILRDRSVLRSNPDEPN